MSSGDLRTDVANSARIYNYVLGGKDHYPADREAAESMMRASPLLQISMRANRRFMTRVAAYLAESGLRQFLDIGAGLPVSPNPHEVVQKRTPESAVVYVDSDPLVHAYALGLLTNTGDGHGRLASVHADLREPDAIFAAPETKATFDLAAPVAVTVIAVLQLFDDDSQVRSILGRIMGRLAAGSALALSAVVSETDPTGVRAVNAAADTHGMPLYARNLEQITALFEGLDLTEPGVVPVNEWRPDQNEAGIDTTQIGMAGGVAFKR